MSAGHNKGAYAERSLTELFFFPVQSFRVKRVEGVDASPEMIEQGKRKAETAEVTVSKLSLSTADIDELPFEDGRFDCVTVNQVLHHIDDDSSAGYPQHAAALAELGRVTRPGGTLVVNLCSHDQVSNGWWYRELFPNAFERLTDVAIYQNLT